MDVSEPANSPPATKVFFLCIIRQWKSLLLNLTAPLHRLCPNATETEKAKQKFWWHAPFSLVPKQW